MIRFFSTIIVYVVKPLSWTFNCCIIIWQLLGSVIVNFVSDHFCRLWIDCHCPHPFSERMTCSWKALYQPVFFFSLFWKMLADNAFCSLISKCFGTTMLYLLDCISCTRGPLSWVFLLTHFFICFYDFLFVWYHFSVIHELMIVDIHF